MIKKNELNKLNEVDTLIFDMDYTIIRYITINDLLKDKKIVLFPIIDELLVLGFAAINNSKYFESFYNKLTKIKQNLGINGEIITKIVQLVLKQYIVPIKNISSTVYFLSQTYDISCFTDFSKITATMELEKCGLSNTIKNIYVSEPGIKKINLEAYNHLLYKLHKSSQNIIMIGNSIVDVHASKLGINTILMDYYDKFNSNSLEYNTASCVLTTAQDLQLVLQKK